MKLDTTTYTATTSEREKGQRWTTARTWPREIQQSRVEPNTVSYNDATRACEEGQQQITASTFRGGCSAGA